MPDCSFCSEPLLKGRGVMYVKREGRVYYYCSSKCRKNAGLGREGRLKKWTKSYRDFVSKAKEEKKK
jgi:large subunit ribosomal protein L24e